MTFPPPEDFHATLSAFQALYWEKDARFYHLPKNEIEGAIGQ